MKVISFHIVSQNLKLKMNIAAQVQNRQKFIPIPVFDIRDFGLPSHIKKLNGPGLQGLPINQIVPTWRPLFPFQGFSGGRLLRCRCGLTRVREYRAANPSTESGKRL